ncbi:U11/U12 small nuclear ribonucleoprotein 31 kDa protein [Durio zibethinus]|uniref:U11/U12 small nuclear ribonucleoprotein 31 kDa protein n=1 Tax=Durio zibethinus TaxID=66656 RepID=A0A6P5Z028_DURZI|nr:U11/U12 small nuclear ribonucleoprotein 31 kDa protein [Durio zibethinus]
MTLKKKSTVNSDSEEDETFYYRYSSAAAPPSSSSSKSINPNQTHAKSAGVGGGSGGLAPSKSTLYVSNLDYSLTNSDLHTLFSTFGKIARVTVLKDRATRNSRGVAFVQFVSRDDALSAASVMHGKVLNGRTLSASIAFDNGRAPEFIKKRVYKDKSRCYECGISGHLSYECPKNQLGPRERPVPKKARRGGGGGEKMDDGGYWGEEEADGGEVFEEENWASVVDGAAEERLRKVEMVEERKKKKKVTRKASYFSDESDEEE